MKRDGYRRVIGVMGGSYDPPHPGHVSVALNALRNGVCNEVIMMVSPENPFKSGKRMAPAEVRLEMLKILLDTVSDNEDIIKEPAGRNIKVSDFELSLPCPTYSIKTLRALRDNYPDRDFRLLIGTDNLDNFDNWCESDALLKEFGLIVYPRPGYGYDKIPPGSVILKDVPVNCVSSTDLRQMVADDDWDSLEIILGTPLTEFIRKKDLYKEL